MQQIRPSHTLFERGLRVNKVLFAPDGSTLATTGGYRGNAIRVWDCSGWIAKVKLPGHNHSPICFAFAGNANAIVSGGFDKEVKLWDCSKAHQIAGHTSHRNHVTAVACDAAAEYVASGDALGNIFTWHIRALVSPIRLTQVEGRINTLAMSPVGHFLVIGGGIERQLSQIHILDYTNGRPIASLDGHSDWVLWVGFDHDGTRMASGSYGEICIWDTATWQLQQVLRRPNTEGFSTVAFSFSSDNNVFISGAWSHEERRLEVRDTSGKVVGWNVTRDGLLQLWDLATGTLDKCIEAHTNGVASIAYSPKTDQLASGGADGVVRLWNLNSP